LFYGGGRGEGVFFCVWIFIVIVIVFVWFMGVLRVMELLFRVCV